MEKNSDANTSAWLCGH